MAHDCDNGFARVDDLTVAAPYVGVLERHGLTSLDALLAYGGSERLDKAGLPAWRERLRLDLADADGGNVTFYLKRYRHPPASAQRERIRGGARGHGTAWIEWERMRWLEDDGVGCAEPVAFGESVRGGREESSALLTVAVAGESLECWAAGRRERCPRSMVEGLAEFVRRFHGLGYVHRDLYLSHVFYDAASSAAVVFRLIDLHRVMKPSWCAERWRVKDLAALNYSTPRQVATASDRVRFLRWYLGVKRLGVTGRRLVRRVAGKTRRIAEHDLRRLVRIGGAAAR